MDACRAPMTSLRSPEGILRHISIQEFPEAIEDLELIEDYPDDKYDASCLLLGFTSADMPVERRG